MTKKSYYESFEKDKDSMTPDKRLAERRLSAPERRVCAKLDLEEREAAADKKALFASILACLSYCIVFWYLFLVIRLCITL